MASNAFPTDTPLGARLSKLGYTLADVERATGIDRWKMNDLLHGRASITPRLMVKLCDMLKCEPETLTHS